MKFGKDKIAQGPLSPRKKIKKSASSNNLSLIGIGRLALGETTPPTSSNNAVKEPKSYYQEMMEEYLESPVARWLNSKPPV